MFLRRPVSASTLVALAIGGITGVAVAASVFGAGSPALTETATAGSAEVTNRASDLLVQGPTTNLDNGSRGAIQEATPAASDDGMVLEGGIGLSAERPVAGATASTRTVVPGECPVMTDSIRRLYLAFLEREPTADELAREIDQYRSGEADLEALADALATSGRFRTAYGPLGDEAYVRLVYANTIDTGPTEAELRHWTTNLDNGYPRGSVMLAFTESAEFVRLTDTTRPLSGYLTWYPRGTHWYCGAGPADDLPVRPLTGDAVYADYLFTNPGDQDAVTGLTTVLDGRQRVVMGLAEVPGGFTDYRWDGLFVGAENYGDAIDVIAPDDVGWVVVFSPSSIGRQRLGWHVPS